jgi:hypothetical protein
MSTKEKLLERFRRLPSDFTFDELIRLFSVFDYQLDNKGNTSGSRVMFYKGEESFSMHKPHPENTVKKAALKEVYNYLFLKGLL